MKHFGHTLLLRVLYIKIFGKLIPASSVNGSDMFYTVKATDNGKKVSDVDNPFNKATTAAGWEFKDDGKSAETGDVVTAADKDGSGYYLDIPVWFRTTSTSDVNLGLDVEVKQGSDSDTTTELYKGCSSLQYSLTLRQHRVCSLVQRGEMLLQIITQTVRLFRLRQQL